MQHRTLERVAKKHNKTLAQVLLRWGIQLGFVVIPCSTSKTHIEENLTIWNFILDEQDILLNTLFLVAPNREQAQKKYCDRKITVLLF
jgi:diketogulonate reductase-like aldo/keto reductase